jgi:hypothetical protein
MLCLLLIVGALAAQAPVAIADVSPASTAIAGNSTTAQIAYSGTVMSCTTSEIRGVTPPRGTSSISFTLSFGQNGGSCRAFGLAMTATCRGHMTARLTGFSASSTSGTLSLDSDFNCTFRVTLAACSVTVQGPQTNVGGWDFTNITQILNFGALNVAATDSGGTCAGNTAGRTGRGTGSFTGRYTNATRLTMS